MPKVQADKLSEGLESVVRELAAAEEKATNKLEKTALKIYKGTVARVAKDLREMGQGVTA